MNAMSEYGTCTIENSFINKKNSKVTYKDLLESCSEFCRTVSNDKDMSWSVYSSIHEWVSKLRQGDAFEIKFNNTVGGICTKKQNDITPNAATITPCLHAQQQNRLKSRLEVSNHIWNIPVRDKSLSVYDVDYEPTILKFSNDIEPQCNATKNSDSYVIGQPKKRTHRCYLCGQSGHGRYDCTLLKKYCTE